MTFSNRALTECVMGDSELPSIPETKIPIFFRDSLKNFPLTPAPRRRVRVCVRVRTHTYRVPAPHLRVSFNPTGRLGGTRFIQPRHTRPVRVRYDSRVLIPTTDGYQPHPDGYRAVYHNRGSHPHGWQTPLRTDFDEGNDVRVGFEKTKALRGRMHARSRSHRGIPYTRGRVRASDDRLHPDGGCELNRGLNTLCAVSARHSDCKEARGLNHILKKGHSGDEHT